MYLSESLVVEAVWVFFLLGVGILHSIWKATQLVQGTPREAASQRTFLLFKKKGLSVKFFQRPQSPGNTGCRPRPVPVSGVDGEVNRDAISSSGSGPRLAGAPGSLVQGMVCRRWG